MFVLEQHLEAVRFDGVALDGRFDLEGDGMGGLAASVGRSVGVRLRTSRIVDRKVAHYCPHVSGFAHSWCRRLTYGIIFDERLEDLNVTGHLFSRSFDPGQAFNLVGDELVSAHQFVFPLVFLSAHGFPFDERF